MAKTGQSITEFIDSLPPHHATPELRIYCPDDEKFNVMAQVANHAHMKTSPKNVNLIDGVRVRDPMMGGGFYEPQTPKLLL